MAKPISGGVILRTRNGKAMSTPTRNYYENLETIERTI